MEQKIYEILKERFGIEDTINSDTDLVNQWTTVKSILSTLAATSKDNNA